MGSFLASKFVPAATTEHETLELPIKAPRSGTPWLEWNPEGSPAELLA